MPSPPNISARSYILYEHASDKFLAEQNADLKIQPASLTKIMTLYIVGKKLQLGELSLNEDVMISKKAWQTGGSKMFIEVGSSVKVEDLINGIAVQSGNDASIAIAEHIAGSEDNFAILMNYHAKKIGMNNTNFVNATGMPNEQHYTTARDLALLTKHLIKNDPLIYKYFSGKSFKFNKIRQDNRNRLLFTMIGVDGVKTGHTDSAGYCLVSSKVNGDKRLTAVVTGESSSSNSMYSSKQLLGFGELFYNLHLVYKKGDLITNAKVWKGKKRNVQILADRDIFVILPKGYDQRVEKSIEINSPIIAPINSDSSIGMLKVRHEDQVVLSEPLYLSSSMNRSNIIYRAWDQLCLVMAKIGLLSII